MNRHLKIWTIASVAALITAPALTQDTFTYDKLGRLVQVDYDDGQVSKYTYDPAGNRTLVEQGGAPAPLDDLASTAVNTVKEINVLANDTDLNGDTLTIFSVTTPTNGATQKVQIAGFDWVRYTPNTSYSGPDSFSYTVTDGATQVSANVTVDVVSNNGAPVADNETETTNEDVDLIVSPLVGDTDPDNDPLSIGLITAPSHGTATKNGSTITYDPAPDYFGPDSFTYEASDGSLTDIGTVTVTVVSVNDAPVADTDAITTNEDTPGTIDPRIGDTDIENDPLTVTSISQAPSNGVATYTATSVTYTPASNHNGVDMFKYTISDGNGGTAEGQVDVAITAVNDPVIAVDDTEATNEDTPLTFDPRADDIDPDGPALTVTSVTVPQHGTASYTSTSVTYTPAANYNGADNFDYVVSDGLSSDTGRVDFTVNAVNDSPDAVVDNYTNVNKLVWTTLNVRVNDTDPEGDTLTITAVNDGPSTVEIINGGTQVRYKCTGAACGEPQDFNYTISDGNGGTDVGTVNVTHQSGGGGGGGPDP